MSEFSLSELRDMAPAYVLGALSEEETSAFEIALAASAELKREVDAYRAVVAELGHAQQLTPPTALRARFLNGIAAQKASANSPSGSTAATPATPESHPLTVSTGGASARPAAERAPRERNWFTGVIAVGLAASLVFAIQRNSQVTTLNTQLALRDSILAARTVQLAQRDSTLDTMLEDERNLVRVNLITAPDNGPSMQFYWNVKMRRGVLHAVGLKPADAGHTYQLWLIKDGKPVPSRTFNTGSDNTSLQWGIELPTATTGVTAVAVTLEPAGGSPAPTTTPFLVGELPKGLQ